MMQQLINGVNLPNHFSLLVMIGNLEVQLFTTIVWILITVTATCPLTAKTHFPLVMLWAYHPIFLSHLFVFNVFISMYWVYPENFRNAYNKRFSVVFLGLSTDFVVFIIICKHIVYHYQLWTKNDNAFDFSFRALLMNIYAISTL